MRNTVDHKVTISTADDASLLVHCSCGVYLLDTLSGLDLGDLLTLVERHLQERDIVTIVVPDIPRRPSIRHG